MKKQWSSRLGFLLVSIGTAVGLGNLWRFPFITGENGGGAFVLIYIAFVVLIGVPIIIGEVALGRMGGGSAVTTTRRLRHANRAGPQWQIIGALSLAVPFIGLSYYAVVAGWSFQYMFGAVSQAFQGFDQSSSADYLSRLQNNSSLAILFHAIFIGATIIVVGFGLQKGVERAARFMMPGLFLILLILLIYVIFAADFAAGFHFLFNPDFSKLTPTAILLALGQAFFSIAVGVGAFITYGAYLPKSVSIPKSAAIIVAIDTLVAIMAGLVIFSIVFAEGLDAAGGPGLIFVILPVAFGGMAGGAVAGGLFFLMLFFAAFTSAIGMLEPVVSYLEEKFSTTRFRVALFGGLAIWAVGLGPALSFGVWSDLKPLDFGPFAGKGIFEIYDFLIANILLPVNALFISLFAGWVIKTEIMQQELQFTNGKLYPAWRSLIRYVVPLAILLVLVNGLA